MLLILTHVTDKLLISFRNKIRSLTHFSRRAKVLRKYLGSGLVQFHQSENWHHCYGVEGPSQIKPRRCILTYGIPFLTSHCIGVSRFKILIIRIRNPGYSFSLEPFFSCPILPVGTVTGILAWLGRFCNDFFPGFSEKVTKWIDWRTLLRFSLRPVILPR